MIKSYSAYVLLCCMLCQHPLSASSRKQKKATTVGQLLSGDATIASPPIATKSIPTPDVPGEPEQIEAGIQTTLHRIAMTTPSPQSSTTSPVTEQPHDQSFQMLQLKDIQLWQQEEDKKRTLQPPTTQATIMHYLKQYGALDMAQKAQDCIESALMSEQQRILYLDQKLELSHHLEYDFDTNDARGEWLSRGLVQAIDTKSIDAITKILTIIHQYGLTYHIAADIQARARACLEQHQEHILINILPKTQSSCMQLSPRSQTAHQALRTLGKLFGHKDPELSTYVEKCLISFKEKKS